MTTRTPVENPDRTQVLAWIARQLQWERTLDVLRHGRGPQIADRNAA